jgi:hypothetical protein
MFLLDQQDGSSRLAIERRRDMKDGLGDDVLDLLVVYRRLFLECIVGASALDEIKE